MEAIKATETVADVHGSTKAKPGDWVAFGSPNKDASRWDWVRMVERANEEKVYVKDGVTMEKRFIADIVDMADRDER